MNAAKKIILLLWFIVASLASASALTPGATETRVGQKSFAALETRQAEPFQTAGLPQRNRSYGYELAPDSLLAAEGGEPMLFRGVPGNRTQKAILGQQGVAIPRGTALDEASLMKHVLGEDVNAGVTSWTTDRGVAVKFSGPNGTVIKVPVGKVSNQIVPRPSVAKYGSESEVLLKGTVQGTPTPP